MQKCHPTRDCESDIFLPLLPLASQPAADAKKEGNQPICGEKNEQKTEAATLLEAMCTAYVTNSIL